MLLVALHDITEKALNFFIVKDVNIKPTSNIFIGVAVGNLYYFITSDGTNGAELWKNDGTMVKDIAPGVCRAAGHQCAGAKCCSC